MLAAVCIFAASLIKEKEPEAEIDNGHSFNVEFETLEEINGFYVSSAYNIDFPSRKDLSEQELKSEMDEIINTAYDLGLNSVFFQVRSACDALYPSEIFPVSEYLSSSDLQLDCLEYMVGECRKRDMKLFAWVNPLRVSASARTVDNLKNETALSLSQWIVEYNGILYFDPAAPQVRKLICDGIAEICRNYSVDGIVFDDYFYPYKAYETAEDGTKTEVPFDDSETFSLYGADFDSLESFRREQVNTLVKEAFDTVKANGEGCLFGVAPFGIWKNGEGDKSGSLTDGLQSYTDIYCDTVAWIEGGYVDFAAPQIYWDMEAEDSGFKALAAWWNDTVTEANKGRSHKVRFFISHAAYKYRNIFTEGEMTRQLEFADDLSSYKGSLFYNYSAVRENLLGIKEELKSYYTNEDTAQ